MSDDKTPPAAEPTKPGQQAQATWEMPCQEMMVEMMTRCGCHPEQWSEMWAACCGAPPEKQEKGHPL